MLETGTWLIELNMLEERLSNVTDRPVPSPDESVCEVT